MGNICTTTNKYTVNGVNFEYQVAQKLNYSNEDNNENKWFILI